MGYFSIYHMAKCVCVLDVCNCTSKNRIFDVPRATSKEAILDF